MSTKRPRGRPRKSVTKEDVREVSPSPMLLHNGSRSSKTIPNTFDTVLDVDNVDCDLQRRDDQPSAKRPRGRPRGSANTQLVDIPSSLPPFRLAPNHTNTLEDLQPHRCHRRPRPKSRSTSPSDPRALSTTTRQNDSGENKS